MPSTGVRTAEMRGNVFVTGGTGALGPALLAELSACEAVRSIAVAYRPLGDGPGRWRELLREVAMCGAAGADVAKLRPIELVAAPWEESFGLPPALRRPVAGATDVVLHAAADTRFRGPRAELELVNVEGTRRLLEWASTCPRLRSFVLLGTTCVAGTRTGPVPETPIVERPEFANDYEATKWAAERLVADSALPSRIVRLGTSVGRERDGYVRRIGGFHHALLWMRRGLIPMIPGSPETHVDLLSDECVARVVARVVVEACAEPRADTEVFHVSSGDRGPRLDELLDALGDLLACHDDGWRRGRFERPIPVAGATFDRFRESVERSGDAVLCQVLQSLESMASTLRFPKTYETANAERVWGGPLPVPDWRNLLGRVVAFCVRSDWRRSNAVRPGKLPEQIANGEVP